LFSPDAAFDWGKVKRTMGAGLFAFAARPTSVAKVLTSESVRIVSGLPSALEYVNVQNELTAWPSFFRHSERNPSKDGSGHSRL
jgi:hypothetical protein